MDLIPFEDESGSEMLKIKDVNLAAEVGTGVGKWENLRFWLGIPGHKCCPCSRFVKCSCEGWTRCNHVVTMRKPAWERSWCIEKDKAESIIESYRERPEQITPEAFSTSELFELCELTCSLKSFSQFYVDFL